MFAPGEYTDVEKVKLSSVTVILRIRLGNRVLSPHFLECEEGFFVLRLPLHGRFEMLSIPHTSSPRPQVVAIIRVGTHDCYTFCHTCAY